MKTLLMACAAMLLVGCVQQRVAKSLDEATVVEGRQFAAEMAAQSPFATVEMRWSEAGKRMEQRNRTFLSAKARHESATEQKPEVGEMTSQMRRAVTSSVGGALKPAALIEAVRNPVVQVPKQLASLGSIKDVSHTVAQSAWKDASASVDADLTMRSERVKLQQLLRKGELIDRELRILTSSAPLPADADPALVAAVKTWRGTLDEARETWLGSVRDMFDAEYHDVKFVRDTTGLPTYADVDQPNLADWQRWCRLAREKELIEALTKAHAEKKPAVPGATMVGNRLESMIRPEESQAEETVRDGAAVRREVRTLVQRWRKMKQAQAEALRLESRHESPVIANIEDVKLRQRIFNSRAAEIDHVGVIWLMDEKCWE